MQTTQQVVHNLNIRKESIYANHKRLSQPIKASQMPIEKLNLKNHFRLFDKFIQTQTKDSVIHRQCLELYKARIAAEDTKSKMGIMHFYQLPLAEFAQALINGDLGKYITTKQSTSCFRALPKER